MKNHSEIKIESNSGIPKYIQVANIIAKEISTGCFQHGGKLPSINQLSRQHAVSRDTAEKAYKDLHHRKLVYSVNGLGNFAISEYAVKANILFLVNKPCSYKMEVYDSFVTRIGESFHVDMYMYYNDELLFINALNKNLHNYDYFVVLPHFKAGNGRHTNYTPAVLSSIENVPKDKLLILDNTFKGISDGFSAVYQDFENDIFDALAQALENLKEYEKLVLVYPQGGLFPAPAGLVTGFLNFCSEYGFCFEIIEKITDGIDFEQKVVYITIEDKDLVCLMHQIRDKKIKIGSGVGVISYNETPLKALLDISVLSTDFSEMGNKAAKIFLNKKNEICKNPFHFIRRSSL